MKKRFLAAIILGTTMVMQTACGGTDTSTTETATEETATEDAEAEESATEETENVEAESEEAATEETSEEASTEESEEESAEETDATAEADMEEFTSADGWSITYDKNLYMLGEIDEHTTMFNYLGESGGTNAMTIEYTTEKTPDEVFLEKKESWSGTLMVTDATFPTTEDKKCYCVQGIADSESNGMSETWYISEYNGGTLTLELLSHTSGDDEMDMEVSDNMSALLYSLTIDNYEDQVNYTPSTAEEYVGEWAESTAERVVATIAKSEDGSGYDVEITWREDLPQKDVYTMHIDGEEPDSWFYTDGMHVLRTFSDDETYTDEVQYEDGTGYFYLCKADGILYWCDYTVEDQAESVTTFKVAEFEE